MKKVLILTILLTVLISCGDADTYEDIETPTNSGPNNPDPVTPDPGTPSEPSTAVTYDKNVKAIITANCVSCHQNGRAASFRPLTTYAEVKIAVQSAGLLDRIQLQNGEQGLMPQGGRMSQTNIDLIKKWNTDGLKEN